MNVTCEDLGNKLLGVCDSNPERLAIMLRTPFLDGQSPISWSICNFPSSLFSSPLWDRLPPILSLLLERCPGWEKHSPTVDAIHKACCVRNSNELFQLLNPHFMVPASPGSVYSVDKREAGSGSEFDFVIPNFPSRMLVEGKVDMWFVCECESYQITLVASLC
jgi:hypothetical protein